MPAAFLLRQLILILPFPTVYRDESEMEDATFRNCMGSGIRITPSEPQKYPGDPIRVPDRHSLPSRTADIINMDQSERSDGKVRAGRNVILSE